MTGGSYTQDGTFILVHPEYGVIVRTSRAEVEAEVRRRDASRSGRAA